ncbi:MAG: M28 family peptidase [Armatimonadota bacterium]
MRHVRFLSEELGPRPPGVDALDQGCDYVLEALQAAGYDNARKIGYQLPNGKILGNIAATRAGKSDDEIVLAAHLDTVAGSPGANDDASGIGVILELAEMLADAEPPRSVRFAVFKSEETLEGYDVHGFGSLQFIEGLEPGAVEKIVAACWLDKIGAGPTLKVMHIDGTPAGLAEHLHELAVERGMEPTLIAAKRWSEAMAFEDRGIATAWVEYGPAPNLHLPEDDIANVDQEKLAAVGALIHAWIMEEPAP